MKKRPTILLIEDDEYINNMLASLLKNHNYLTIQAYSGTEGLLLFNSTIDLVLLDLMLPGKNGSEVIKEIKQKSNIPVIIMSAIDEIESKIDLFKLGANDYITKPFNNEELLLRIEVHLKNQNFNKEREVLIFKDIEMHIATHSVLCNKKKVSLTKNEFLLLKALIENKNQVLTKSNLFSLVWGDEDSADDNTLNVHISKIRNKLKKCHPNEEYIETVWSIGYRLKK